MTPETAWRTASRLVIYIACCGGLGAGVGAVPALIIKHAGGGKIVQSIPIAACALIGSWLGKRLAERERAPNL